MSNTREMTREEWLAERKTGIGGSDAAAVLGISPWRTAVDVWLDKTGRKQPGEETEAMRIGTELEDFVARRYVERTGRQVQRYNRMVKDGCLIGNFDRLVVPDGGKVASHMGEVRTDTLLECKTSGREWEDGVPLHYQVQVQHYMGLVPCLAHADVACLFLGRKHFETFRVERDDAVIRTMRERLAAWWAEYVEGDKMPPPTNEADCRLLWARSNPGKSVEATAEIAARLEAYRTFKDEERRAKEDALAAMSDVCAYLGDAETLADPQTGRPLATWKSAKDSAVVDWEALARSLGATDARIRDFTTVKTGSRRFVAKAPAPDAAARK